MPPVLQKNREKKRRLDNAVAGTSKIQSFFVTTTAGEDETCEGNPGNSNGDAFDVAPRYQRLKTNRQRKQQRRNQHLDATRTDSSGVIPDDRQPDASCSLSAGHMAKRTEIGDSSSRSMPPKRTVCYQQREWQPAHFIGKDYHAHSGPVEIERQWLCFSPPMKKPYCQSCCLFGDPSAMQKQWANGVSGNPKNFEVKIKSHEKTQAHVDAIIAFGRWKTGQRIGRVQEQAIATEATFWRKYLLRPIGLKAPLHGTIRPHGTCRLPCTWANRSV